VQDIFEDLSFEVK